MANKTSPFYVIRDPMFPQRKIGKDYIKECLICVMVGGDRCYPEKIVMGGYLLYVVVREGDSSAET